MGRMAWEQAARSVEKRCETQMRIVIHSIGLACKPFVTTTGMASILSHQYFFLALCVMFRD